MNSDTQRIASSSSSPTAFLGRQPILNTSGRIYAYELLYRQGRQGGACFDNPSLATARVLVNTLTTMGIEQVLGRKLAFVNFGHELLESDVVCLLPKERVFLEILEDVEPDRELVERCHRLRSEGFQFVLDDFVCYDCLTPFIDIATMLKLDLKLLDDHCLREHVKIARRFDLRIVAEKVEDQQAFERCRSLDFDYFQGYHFARPVILEHGDVPVMRQRIIQLLNQILTGVEIKVLADEIARDIGLSYKLLRYINSAGLAGLDKTDNIRHALIRLGQQQLYRWLSLLLFANHDAEQMPPLMATAMQRGFLLEKLGHRRHPHAGSDFFVLGMFSMLDALLQMPMANILAGLALPLHLKEALLYRGGPYGDYLLLAEAIEELDWLQIQRIAGRLELGEDAINQANLNAMAHSEGL